MQMSSSRFDRTQVVLVKESRIDAASAIAFKDKVRDLTQGGAETVVLDLKQVDFIDSSGLGAIVATMKQMAGTQTLQLAALRPNVDKVFRLTRMDSIFKIHDSAEKAVESHAD